MKHTEIPNAIDDKKISNIDNENPERILEIGDKVIYASIRRYMNPDTRECFPSIQKIKEKTKCGQAKINKAIDRLIQAGFITKTLKRAPNGKLSNYYYFPKTKLDAHFERFTDEFLDLDLPINIKEYYMDIQKYLYYDKDHTIGKCSFSNSELARRLGISIPTVKKYNTYLYERGFLDEETTDKTDEAGFTIINKVFNLTALQQAQLWMKAVTDQLSNNTEQIYNNTEDINELKARNEELEKRIAILEKECALERNRVQEQKEYSF